MNSFEKTFPHIGFNFPDLFNLKLVVCLNLKVLPAVGELFNLRLVYLVKRID